MKSPQDIAEEIVETEGGYVNDPDDPGGPTKFGITLAKAREWGLDLDGDGDVDKDDVRIIPHELAVEKFLDCFFYKRRIDWLPAELRANAFDFSVHAGVNSIRTLQRLCARIVVSPIKPDGMIGPMTRSLVQEAADKIGEEDLDDAYAVERRRFYYALGDRRPQSRKYCRRKNGGKGGWITRAESFMSREYWLSRQQHDARVRGWM